MEKLVPYIPAIVNAIVLIAEVVLIIVGIRHSKDGVSSELWSYILSLLPGIVKNSESIGGDGATKKTRSINDSLYVIERKLGRKLTDTETDYYTRNLSDQIEFILTTPQKKEVIEDVKKV